MTISTIASSSLHRSGVQGQPGSHPEEQAFRAEVKQYGNRKGNQNAEGIHPGEPARQAGALAFTLRTSSQIDNSEHDQGRPDHHPKG